MKNVYLKLPVVFFLLLTVASSTNAIAAKKAQRPSERAIMHNNQGVTALYSGDNDRALFEFKTATELSPKYVEAWNNLGLAYKFKGQFDLAVDALKMAIFLDKKYASPYNHLGTVYYNLNQYDKALEQFKLAIKYNAKFSDAYYNRGLTYAAIGHASHNKAKLNEAINALVKATTFNAEHPYAHNEAARLYQELGQYEQAIIRYKLALEINPNLTDSWINLSTLYNQTGETLKAQQALSQAMSQKPNSGYVHMNMGLSYLKEKNYTLALREFDQVIRTEPTNDQAYYNAGFTHFQLGINAKNKGDLPQVDAEFDQAIRAYQSALKLKPNFADAAFNVGFTYQAKQDLPHAIEAYQQALKIDENNPRALFALGGIYQAQGDTTNASTYYCRFLKLKPSGFENNLNQVQEQVKSWGGCK